jgi:hypothetical protein
MAIIDKENRLLKIQYAPPRLNFKILLLGHFAACVFYRRKILSKYKLDINLNYAIDYDQCLRMAKDGVLFYRINKPLIGWRRHATAKSISRKESLKEETLNVRKRYITNTYYYSYYISKLFINTVIFIGKLYGVKDIVEFYSAPDKLAFNAKYDSLTKHIFRQIIPYL